MEVGQKKKNINFKVMNEAILALEERLFRRTNELKMIRSEKSIIFKKVTLDRIVQLNKAIVIIKKVNHAKN
jgi:hypothetical protein